MSETDWVEPRHYQHFSVETIEMMVRIYGAHMTAFHCEMCAFKYKMRAGHKPGQPVSRDLEKAAWYLTKARELRNESNS